MAYKCGLVRIGVEGWTEECRRKLGKPLSDADLRRLVDALKTHRQAAELYLMADYPGWSYGMLDPFMRAIGADDGSSPPLFVKSTYFDPLPGTPMGGAAIAGQWCDTAATFARLGGYNHRVRMWGCRSRARSAWRTMMHRCTADQARNAPPEPRDINTPDSFMTWRDGLASNLRDLLGEWKGYAG
jgi:hypothetical protein